MKYILESEKEFERLEKQSETELYDFKQELSAFQPPHNGKILDAGCGSGIVARYLAESYPAAKIFACDQSRDRIKDAMQSASNMQNIHFSNENLTNLSFESNSFDAVVCRFVLEHLSKKSVTTAVAGLYRCVKPGGQIWLVDVDGMLFNIYPQTRLVSQFLTILAQKQPLDLQIGRKLLSFLADAGCDDLQWKIETMQFSKHHLEIEKKLLVERFSQAMPVITSLLGSSKKAKKFLSEYIGLLEKKETILFYNKFIVSGRKPKLTLIKNSR